MSDRARAALVAEARSWIGTPYRHQASVRGVGCDCLGLLRGLWRARYGTDIDGIPAYGPDWSETSGRQTAGSEALWRALDRHLRPVSGSVQAGQVLLFRMRDSSVAKHLGVISDCVPRPRFIHAYSGHGVVESPLSPPWARRIVARFDLI